jgi:hypothetical protein
MARLTDIHRQQTYGGAARSTSSLNTIIRSASLHSGILEVWVYHHDREGGGGGGEAHSP